VQDQKAYGKTEKIRPAHSYVSLLSAVSYLVATANERLWWDRHWHTEQSRPEISDMVSTQIDGRKMRGERTDVDRLAPLLQKTGKCSCSYILSCNAANLTILHCHAECFVYSLFRRTEQTPLRLCCEFMHKNWQWIKGFIASTKSSKYFLKKCSCILEMHKSTLLRMISSVCNCKTCFL